MAPLRLAHADHPTAGLRHATPDDPLRVLVSGCLLGLPVGVDGTDYGLGGCLHDLLLSPAVVAFPFCPEAVALGVPRTMPDIYGGDGFDVLNGTARVLDEHGADLTAEMVRGAEAALAAAQRQGVELAILTDMSAACGTQVISDGCRLVEERRYQAGVGVTAALLLRHGVPVVSQRDYRTLSLIRAHLDTGYAPEPALIDHHETLWYRQTFGGE
jgi:uncharacterized protein YbbK (DUF523 family)